MQVAGGGVEAMKQSGQAIERSGSVDVYDLRLMTLLHELVRKNRKWGAARVLGVDPRTVAMCMRTGRLSRRVREALELGLQSGQGTAAALQRERNDALERRIGEVEQRLRAGLDEMQASVAEQIAGLGEELQQGAGLSESLRDVERRLAQLEPATGAGGSATEEDAGPGAGRKVRPAAQGEAPFRPYPELVTLVAGTRRGSGVRRRHGDRRRVAGGAGGVRAQHRGGDRAGQGGGPRASARARAGTDRGA